MRIVQILMEPIHVIVSRDGLVTVQLALIKTSVQHSLMIAIR